MKEANSVPRLSRGLARAVVAVLLALALSGTARAGEPVVDEASFLAAIQETRAQLREGRGKAGLDLLARSLERHRGKDYVRGQRTELEDLVRRLSFAVECQPPAAKAVVHGDLKRFTPTTGEIEIVYTAGSQNDFESKDGLEVFPARFRGPFKVDFQGGPYLAKTENMSIVQIGMEKNPKTGRDLSWLVSFGTAPYDEGKQRTYAFPKILVIDGDNSTEAAKGEGIYPFPGDYYHLQVRVTATRVNALSGNVSIGSVAKPEGQFGYLAFRMRNWSEIRISGLCEPSWIQAKIDAAVEVERVAFDATFDAHAVLPGWLYEGGAATAASTASTRRFALPRGLPPELHIEYLAALARAVGGDAEGTLAAAAALRAKGASASIAWLLAANAWVAFDRLTSALEAVDAALTEAPNDVQAALLRADILQRLGRDADMATVALDVAKNPDADASAFESAIVLVLRAGRLDDARQIAGMAGSRGIRSEGIDELARMLVTAENGPSWTKSSEVKSANYRVVSDLDPETCRKAAAILEDALVDFRTQVSPLKPAEKRLYSVYLFAGQAGFQRYAADAWVGEGRAMENVAGLYSPLLKQLLIWNLPTREEMLRTIRHEGFHQYLDRLLPDPPVWFNEGLAVYFEVVPKSGEGLHLERPRADYLEELRGKPLVPLAKFLTIRPAAFYAGGRASYAQAWLLVHMLRHSGPKHLALFRTLLAKLETQSGADAVQTVFPAESNAALDEELRAYLATLLAKK